MSSPPLTFAFLPRQRLNCAAHLLPHLCHPWVPALHGIDVAVSQGPRCNVEKGEMPAGRSTGRVERSEGSGIELWSSEEPHPSSLCLPPLSCNDATVANKTECVGYYVDPALDPVLVPVSSPREWSNLWPNFDNVGNALMACFLVATLNGYTTLMVEVSEPGNGVKGKSACSPVRHQHPPSTAP